jgi:hypothetical protein
VVVDDQHAQAGDRADLVFGARRFGEVQRRREREASALAP